MWPVVAGKYPKAFIFYLPAPHNPLDLLTCHPQVHLAAFRRPNHAHFNLCLPRCSRSRGSERDALCVRALDVMHGKR